MVYLLSRGFVMLWTRLVDRRNRGDGRGGDGGGRGGRGEDELVLAA